MIRVDDLIQCDGGPDAGSSASMACPHTELRRRPGGGTFGAPGWTWVDVPSGFECVACRAGFCVPYAIKRAFRQAGVAAYWVDEEMARRKQTHSKRERRA